MNETGCPMWDEFHGCCMWERIEKIFCFPWEVPSVKENDPLEACFEDMA